MCGLVGIIGANLTSTNLDAFMWMLHFDVTRGRDSTGVAIRRTNAKTDRSDITLLKTEGLPYNLYRKFPEVFTDRGAVVTKVGERVDWMMGHNRAATVGGVNAANAHPFHHGNIIGCHNGTISAGLYQLPSSPTLPATCTDSEKIMYALSQGWSLQRIMDTLTGAAALAWWDSDKQTYNLYRNKDRPLYYAMIANKSVLVYASEQWILRNAVSVSSRNTEVIKEIHELPEDTHLTLHMDKGAIKEQTETKITPKKVASAVVHTYPHQNYAQNHQQKNFKNHKVPAYLAANTGSKRVEPFRSHSGWLDRSDLTAEEFKQQTKFGCSLCGCDLEFEEHQEGFVKWMTKDTPLCSGCSSDFKLAV